MAKAYETNPSPLTLCINLAREDHRAGVLLERIVHWFRYGRAEIPLISGYWIANDRTWWMREACLNHKDKENEQCAPASPTCADVHAALNSKSGQEEISLKSLYEMCETTAKKFHSEAIAAGKFSGTLTAKEKGYIAQSYFRLGNFTNPNDQPVDFRPDALDIIAFYVSNTTCFYDTSCSYTPAFLLYKDVGEVVNDWIKAGMPKHETAYPTLFSGCAYKKSEAQS